MLRFKGDYSNNTIEGTKVMKGVNILQTISISITKIELGNSSLSDTKRKKKSKKSISL